MEDKLAKVLAALIAREPIFHRPEFGTTREDFENMTDLSFWEVGASGHRYSREAVLNELERRHTNVSSNSEHLEASEFEIRELALDTFLLTYRLAQGERLTRRVTIWRQVEGQWKILYHQGTVIARTSE